MVDIDIGFIFLKGKRWFKKKKCRNNVGIIVWGKLMNIISGMILRDLNDWMYKNNDIQMFKYLKIKVRYWMGWWCNE